MERKRNLNYLNVILTIIAILLLLIYFKPSGGVTPSLNAQDTNYTLVRDEGLANATKDIADSNREIAKSIDGLSDSANGIAKAIESVAGAISSAGSKSGSYSGSGEIGKIEVKKPE